MDSQQPEQHWISLRAYARHRAVRLSAVQKAIASGRVTAVRRKGDRVVAIEQISADEQWLKNTDPDQAARTNGIHPAPERDAQPAGPSAAAQPVPASGNRDAPAAQLTLQPPGGERVDESAATGAAASATAPADASKDFGYLENRAKREGFQAKQAELDYLQAIGELVPKAELREAGARRYRAIRDKLLNIPNRLAAILAAEKDPAIVHATLGKELKQVLHELSDDAGAEVARGTAVGMAA